ncbi:MAG TPA: hypothetical protein VF223_07985 [Trebonia sp.]
MTAENDREPPLGTIVWRRLAASGVVPEWSICVSLRSGAQSLPGGSGLSGSPNPLVVILVIAAA